MAVPRTVLFDLDGTLLDSVPLIIDSFEHTFATCGLPVPPRARLLTGVGIPLGPHFSRYCDDAAVVARLVAVYREFNLAHHDARIRAFPGVPAMLDTLRANTVALGVVTSKNRSTTERGLELTGLAGYVDALVTSDDVTHPKPHPEPVLRALGLLSAEAADAVFVGDSLHDLHAGRAAGVRTGAALWGPFTQHDLQPGAPDFWLASPFAVAPALGFPHSPE